MTFKDGDRIVHPKDGCGTVRKVIGGQTAQLDVLDVDYDDGTRELVEARDVQKTVLVNPMTSGFHQTSEVERAEREAQASLSRLAHEAAKAVLSTSQEIGRLRAHVGGVEVENLSLKADLAALRVLHGLTTPPPPTQAGLPMFTAAFAFDQEVEEDDGEFSGRIRGYAVKQSGKVMYSVETQHGEVVTVGGLYLRAKTPAAR